MMNTTRNPTTTTMHSVIVTPTSMKRAKTSILPDHHESSSDVIEILGSYWPRKVLHPAQQCNHQQNIFLKSKSMKDGVVHKKSTLKPRRKQRSRSTDIQIMVPHRHHDIPVTTPMFVPLSPASSSTTSTTTSTQSSPSLPRTTTVECPFSFLVQVETPPKARRFSTVTGRPISPDTIKKTSKCFLLPPPRTTMMHQRRNSLQRRKQRSATF